MNRSLRLLEVSLSGLIVSCLLVIVIPLALLAFYNHASPADDYCFADTALKYGYWQAQRFYYNGWSGRYFHNLVVHASPLVWHWRSGYTVIPIVYLLALLAGFYYLVRTLLQTRSVSLQISAAAALSFLFLADLVSVPEFAYWIPGLGCYSLSFLFFVLLIGLLVRHDQQSFGWRWRTGLIESLLITAIVGSSETSMLMVMSLLAMVTLGQLLYRRTLPPVFIVWWAVGLISCYFLIQAPGNFVRMAAYPQRFGIRESLVALLPFSLDYFIKQFSQTALLPLTILYLPIASSLVEARSPVACYFRLNPLLAFLHWGATLLLLMFLHYWAVGVPPVPRLQNGINLVFLLGWFYNVAIWVRLVRSPAKPARFVLSPVLSGVAGLGLGLACWFNPVVNLLLDDLASGRAKQYDSAMRHRYEVLARSPENDPVVLQPLPVLPASLVVEDLKDNPQHLWNRCWAGYYHKETISLH